MTSLSPPVLFYPTGPVFSPPPAPATQSPLRTARDDTRPVLISAAAPLLSSISTTHISIQNSTDSFLDQTSQRSPDSSQASAFARGAVSSTTLETAFSKVLLLLPQLWGTGASRPGALEHDEILETLFSVVNHRSDAYRHLEVFANHCVSSV